MKRIFARHTIILMFLVVAWSYAEASAAEKKDAESAKMTRETLPASADKVFLPALRRLAVEIPQNNIAEFREVMKDQSGKLRGTPSLPMNAQETDSEIAGRVLRALNSTGRFWSLPLEARESLALGSKSENITSQARAKLQAQYDLDGWLKSEIRFSPEQTLIRFMLFDKTGTQIYAREDVMIGAQADLEALEAGFQTAATRLISTLGHDGRLTYSRDELVAVDFGTERGVQPGTLLQAGFVRLTSLHPQTREFLRSKRMAILELEVVESQRGSSLCRIVGQDKILFLREKGKELNSSEHLSLLAWVKDTKLKNLGTWKEASPPETDSLVGVAEKGYRNEPETPQKPGPGEDKPSGLPGSAPGTPSVPQPFTSAPPDWSAPESWTSKSFYVGAGTHFGILNTSRGERYSGLPTTLLNIVHIGSRTQVHPEWFIVPEASFSLFQGGDVEGTLLSFRVPALTEVWNEAISGARVYAGFGMNLGIGQVKTVLVKQDLSHVEILGEAQYDKKISQFGEVQVDLGLSLLGIFAGRFEGHFGLELKPSNFVSKEWTIFSRFEMGPERWSGISLGAQYDVQL